jgi:hypothetical protein
MLKLLHQRMEFSHFYNDFAAHKTLPEKKKLSKK